MASRIGKTVGESQPYWPAAPKRPEGAPNILVVLFDEHRDIRKVTERARILLSGASAEHIEAVGRHLPIDLQRVLPRQMLRAA